MSSWADMWLGEDGPDKENEGGIANVADEVGIADVTPEGGIAHRVLLGPWDFLKDLPCNNSGVGSDPSAGAGGIARDVQVRSDEDNAREELPDKTFGMVTNHESK
eukprot:1077674-Karenia_brevis.AAC.1